MPGLSRVRTWLPLVVVLAGCATVDLKEYEIVPNQATKLAIEPCQNSPERSDFETQKVAFIHKMQLLTATQGKVPLPLQQNAVVEDVFRSAKLTIARSMIQEQSVPDLGRSSINRAVLKYETDYVKSTPLREPETLNDSDFREFVDEFSEQILRHTHGSSQGSDDDFWQRLENYYAAYAAGNFVDYFGNTYEKPTLSLSVTDQELANVVGVFVEMLFDAAAGTPIWVPMDSDSKHSGSTTAGSDIITVPESVIAAGWKAGMNIDDTVDDPSKKIIPVGSTIKLMPDHGVGGTVKVTLNNKAVSTSSNTQFIVYSKLFYPGASKNEPTSLLFDYPDQEKDKQPFRLRYPNQISLLENSLACGMTIEKAKVVNTLASTFASAGSNVAGTAFGTAGGGGASLVLFAKISIGDNKALAAVVRAAVSQLVKRLTVEATYPILESHNFGDSTSYQLTDMFLSPNSAPPTHYSWVP